MKSQLRDIDGYLTLFLKLIFLYDFIFFLLMKPIELLVYTRYSNALIALREKNAELHMSLNTQLLRSIRAKDFLKDNTGILIILKSSFVDGVLKLNFEDGRAYRTEVNEIFYRLISRELQKA